MAEEVVITIRGEDLASGPLMDVVQALQRQQDEVQKAEKAGKKAGDTMSDSFRNSSISVGNFGETVSGGLLDSVGSLATKAGASSGQIAALGTAAAATTTVVAGLAAVIGGLVIGAGALTAAIGASTAQVAKHSEEVIRNAQTVGVSTDAYQEYRHAFDQFDVDVKDLLDTFGTLSDRSLDAQQGTKSFVDDFKLLNVEVSDLKGKNPEELFELMASRISKMDDPTKKLGSTVRVFGDDLGRRLLPLLNQGAEGLEKLKKEAHEAGVVLDRDTLGAGIAMQKSLRDLKARFQGVVNILGSQFLPAVGLVVETAGNVVTAFTSVSGGSEDTREAIFRFTQDGLVFFLEVADATLEQIGGLIEGLDWLTEGITAVVTYGRFFVNTWEIIGNVIEVVFNASDALADLIGGGLLDAIGNLVDVAGQLAGVLDLDLADSLASATASIREFRDEKFAGAAANFEDLKSDLGDIVGDYDDMVDALAGAPGLNEGLEGILDKIGEKNESLRSKLQELKTRTAGADMPDAAGAGGGGKVVAEKVKQGAKQGLDDLQNIVGDAFQEAGEQHVASLRLDALHTQDETIQAVLEHRARVAEIQQRGIEGTKLELELEKSRMELQERFESIQQRRLEAQQKLREQEREAHAEKMEELDAEVAKQNEVFRQMGKGLRRLKGGDTVATDVAAAMGGIATATAEVNDLIHQTNKGLLSGAEAAEKAFGVAGGAVTTFADEMGASAEVQAGILALFEAAAAAASLAAYDYFGFAQHSLAAGLYTAVAAGAGSSKSAGAGASARASGGAGSSGGGSSTRTQGARLSPEELAAETGRSIAEAWAQQQDQAPATTNVYLDASNMTALSRSPDVVDELFDLVEDAGRRRLGPSFVGVQSILGGL